MNRGQHNMWTAEGGAGEPLFVLDFDGVICDSADELAVSAWRAGRQLWPAWRGDEPPPSCALRFRRLRPLLDTGYQAILLLRLVCDEVYSDAQIAAEFLTLAAALQASVKQSRDDLIRLFGEARDAWVREDREGWLARHRFYRPMVDFLPRLMAAGEVRILTTKQKRFTERLLGAAGVVSFPGERVFGLEAGPKTDVLVAFRGASPARELIFVEDRYEALLSVEERPELASVKLFFATWGYALPQHYALAQADSRVTCLDAADLERLING